MLIARKYDEKFFAKNVRQNILSIRESNKINLSAFEPKGEAGDILKYLLTTFSNAKEYGSILKVRKLNYDSLRSAIKNDQIALNFGVDKMIEPIIRQAEVLAGKFTIVATNPPYMSKYDGLLKTYINTYYPDSKSDLAVVFIERGNDLTEENGKCAILSIESWMFLPSSTKFREKLFEKHGIYSMLHLGNGVFTGVVVAVMAAIFSTDSTEKGLFFRLTEGNIAQKEAEALRAISDENNNNRYLCSSSDFKIFPNSMMVYWASQNIKRVFLTADRLDKYATTIQGMVTGDNNRFLREWWEPNYAKCLLSANSASEARGSKAKWFACNKGGIFRKWYGNNDYVVNWENDGYEIKHSKGHNFPPHPFDPVVTWPQISSGDIAFRYKEPGSIADGAGPSMYGKEEDLLYLHGLLNTNVILKISKMISPTLNNTVGQVASYPIIRSESKKDDILRLVRECRTLSKDDWDDYEVSWNFDKHPLFKYKTDSGKLADAFVSYEDHCLQRFNRLKANEEKLNEIAIELYDLKDELTPSIDDERITVRKADKEREAKSFLSYFIGCEMGRYDYTKQGIQFAGEGTSFSDNSVMDDDGIITILDKEYIGRDDVINKLRFFLKESFGEENLSENLDWIADGLGRKDTERSEDIIRSYFVNDFFNNHAHMIYADPTKRSDGRPIYWEISSGKHNAFKALFYIHRYTPNLIAKVRMDYSTPVLQAYDKRRSEIETQLKTTVAPSEYNRLNNELADLKNKIEELTEFDRILKNVADQKIELDLDDGVKVNYPKLSLAASGVKKNAQILEAIK